MQDIISCITDLSSLETKTWKSLHTYSFISHEDGQVVFPFNSYNMNCSSPRWTWWNFRWERGPWFHFSDTFSGRQLYMRLTFSRSCRSIGWLPLLSPLQPLLHVRNQGGLRSQSNTEYWKGYSRAADYELSRTAMVINIPVPHSNDKDCNKNRWGRGVNFILLTTIG